MKVLMRTLPVVLSVAVVLGGCGELIEDVADDDRRDAPQRLAPGYTPCGDEPNQNYGVICHPNQYCSSQTLAICREGCLSNDNCTDEQTCVKQPNEDIGTCVNDDASSNDTAQQDSDDPLHDPQQGYTRCGDGISGSTCHPNQYCADDYWGDCKLGCLSNHNCASDQHCQKEDGEDVGTCVEGT